MSNKEKFIQLVNEVIFNGPADYSGLEDWEDICDFWSTFCTTKVAPKITENGIKVLKFMQENEIQYNNVFKAKDIGEGLFVSSKSVSGSMQKLIKEGFCEKIGGSPVCYKITDLGRNEQLEENSTT